MKRSEFWRRVGLVLVMVCVVTGFVCAQVPPLKSMDDVEHLDVDQIRELIAATYGPQPGGYEQLVELYTRIIKRLQEFRDPEAAWLLKHAYAIRGIWREGVGDFLGAIRDFTKAIEIDPLFACAYGERAEARRKLGDTRGARRDARAAVEAKRKGGDEELRYIKERLAKDPGNPRLILDRAYHKEMLGDYQGAIEGFQEYLRRGQPETSYVYTVLYRAQQRVGDYEGALRTLSKTIQQFPDQDYRLMDMAEIHAEAGDLEGALADLQEYLRRRRREKVAEIEKLTESLNQNPDDARVLLSRAQCWRYLGEYDRALSDVEKTLSVASDPNTKRRAKYAGARIRTAKEKHRRSEYEKIKRRLEDRITRRYRKHHDRDEGQETTP